MSGAGVLAPHADGGWVLASTAPAFRSVPAVGAGSLNAADVYGAALALGLDSVFALDGLGALVMDNDGSVRCEPIGGEQAHETWCWRLSSLNAAVVRLVDVERDVGRRGGPWAGLTPRELVDSLGAVERLIGLPWAGSTGQTAERLILSTHPRDRGGRLLDRAPVIPEPAEGSALELPYMAWSRELSSSERPRAWLHVFDANAQYLGAWVNAYVGHREPVHVNGGGFDSRVAGLWRVPGLDRVEPPFGELLPAPWLPKREWFTTATVRRALDVTVGLDLPECVESWRWPATSRFFRGAGERLRDARAAAIDARRTAAASIWAEHDEVKVGEAVRRLMLARVVLDAVKSLYTVQTGRLGSSMRDETSPWHRPDWGHEIRATARVNLHRAISKLTAAPFAIATDALVFAAGEADPRQFAARAGLRIGDGLGTYRHVASCRREAVGGGLDQSAPELVAAVQLAAARAAVRA